MLHAFIEPRRKCSPQYKQQQLTSRLDSRTLRPVIVLGLLVFSNNTENCTAILGILNVEYWRDLEIWDMGSLRSLKMAPFYRSNTSFHSSCIVIMAISCTVFDVKRDNYNNANFSYPVVFNLHGPLWNRILPQILILSIRGVGVLGGAKILLKCPSSTTLQTTDRQTDYIQSDNRQTDGRLMP